MFSGFCNSVIYSKIKVSRTCFKLLHVPQRTEMKERGEIVCVRLCSDSVTLKLLNEFRLQFVLEDRQLTTNGYNFD
jgi:hypothetical protein